MDLYAHVFRTVQPKREKYDFILLSSFKPTFILLMVVFFPVERRELANLGYVSDVITVVVVVVVVVAAVVTAAGVVVVIIVIIVIQFDVDNVLSLSYVIL